ncbi:glycosyltransferase family 61 protein [Algoriphagus vanfongensis]|uniref:glycosyltransferase family 61 protein n=1 Tax=Algoriphagus vanfongensis TaxID=426371 RepID=UPI0003FF5EC0|nr:glycosyltransferase family 61 protein [Algoriphagus vanfongensis]
MDPKEMVETIEVTRVFPENMTPDHQPLFENSLSATFTKLPEWVLEDVFVLQDTVFSPKELSFFADHTHVNGLGILPLGKRVVNCALKKWRSVDHAIWIKDEWSANYFHWMTDCLPRIWSGLEKGVSDRVLLHQSYKMLPYVQQSLKLIGIKPIYYASDENLKVKKLVLTSRTAEFPHFNIPWTLKTRDKLALLNGKAPHKKVYISRSLAPKRKVLNELEVELLLRKRGFEILHAEKLSVKQQIELMAQTKLFVSLHGAALTNMLFMHPGQSVLEFRNQGDDVTQCYFNLANALGLRYYYTLNQGSEKNTILADFTVDLEALEETLDQILN